MSPAAPHTECPFCNSRHPTDHLCDPARRMLNALLERGMRFDMPTIEFDDPIKGAATDLFGQDTVLVRQLTVQAAVIPATGTRQPALVLGGQDIEGQVLPSLVYAADIQGMLKVCDLVVSMADMAIRHSRTAPATG